MTESSKVPVEFIVCSECGILFGAPVHWMEQRRFDGVSFSCPNGDFQSFGDDERTSLKEEVALLSSSFAEGEERTKKAEDGVYRLEQSINGYKGIIAKLTNEARDLREQLKLEN